MWGGIQNVLKEISYWPRTLYPMKLSFKSEEIKTEGVHQQQTTLEEMLKDISEGEKRYRSGTQIYITLKVSLVLKLLKDRSFVLFISYHQGLGKHRQTINSERLPNGSWRNILVYSYHEGIFRKSKGSYRRMCFLH